MSEEAWIVFRGQILTEGNVPEHVANVEQVVEVVKAHKLSKSYAKLVETPFYHPNVSYGDILKVAPCSKELNDKVAIIEFSGIIDEADETFYEEGLGTGEVELNPENIDFMFEVDKQAKPIVLDKHKQGLVYEPVGLINHGTYKINVAYEAENKSDLDNLKNYFNTYDAVFQPSQNKKYGSVGFNTETKFETAVKCLEDAPGVVSCFIAFNPKEFPSIGYSQDLIPKPEEEGEE